jgi:plastocyanin
MAACGSGTSTGQSAPPAGGTPPPANTIVIDNFAFAPGTLTVKPGAKVTVTNKDTTTHTVTATTGKAFDTGNVAPGASGTFTAPTKPGSYPYICSIHPFMKGTLTVS